MKKTFFLFSFLFIFLLLISHCSPRIPREIFIGLPYNNILVNVCNVELDFYEKNNYEKTHICPPGSIRGIRGNYELSKDDSGNIIKLLEKAYVHAGEVLSELNNELSYYYHTNEGFLTLYTKSSLEGIYQPYTDEDTNKIFQIYTQAKASSELEETISGKTSHYKAKNICEITGFDFWAESSKGNGKGEYIDLNVVEPENSYVPEEGNWIKAKQNVRGIIIMNGAFVSDLYKKNPRVKKAEILVDGKYKETIDIKDTKFPQIIYFSKNYENTGDVKFTITDVYNGTDFKNCCITKLFLFR